MNVALHPQPDAHCINVLSLCTGGYGLDLGVELAIPGARTVCMVEREAYAVAQLVSAMETGLMAPAPVWSDAGTFNGRPWRGVVDLLIGGIPCQPHSLAGKRGGSGDERDLWTDARRILVQSRAGAILIENVPGMLSAKPGLDPGALRVWRDLQRLGFAVEGGLFSAAEVGASHERERLFILGVAHANGRLPARRCAEPEQETRGRAYAEFAGSGYGFSSSMADAACSGCGREGDACIAPDGLNDICQSLDNAVCRRWSAGRHDHSSDVGHESGSAGQFGLDDAPRERGGAISVQPGRPGPARSDLDRPGLFPPGPTDLSRWRDTLERAPQLEPAIRRVADGLASRLDIARVDRLRLLGNGVVPLAAAYALRTLAARLATRGSARAGQLVRMMGHQI